VDELFGEYAAAYSRGERPQGREFLARAGEQADELARLIDSFLTRAPAPTPDEHTLELFEAWQAGESPLLRLRTAHGVTLDTVVAELVRRLGLHERKTEKLKRYYHELEAGLLVPEHVDRRVWNVLAETLGARVSDLVECRPRPPAFPIATFARAAHMSGALSVRAMAQQGQEDKERDEIDALFHSAGKGA
jgi:hypothetical protein